MCRPKGCLHITTLNAGCKTSIILRSTRNTQRHVIIFLSSSSSSSCFHLVYCPYDTESILMIALISVLILQAAIALSGVIESSQLLCCTVEVSVRVC